MLFIIDQILSHPTVIRKIENFNKQNDNNQNINENILLQTIRIPKNLLFLSERLPRSNYEKHLFGDARKHQTKSQDSLPDINKNQITKSPKKKKKEEDCDNSELHPSPTKKKKITDDPVASIKLILEKDRERIKSPNKNIEVNKKNFLPEINNNKHLLNKGASDREIIPIKNDQLNLRIINNEHLKEIYQVYAPYLKNNSQSLKKYDKYVSNEHKSINSKNIEKYYEYNKLKKIESKKVVNRKLSPIKRSVKLLKLY